MTELEARDESYSLGWSEALYTLLKEIKEDCHDHQKGYVTLDEVSKMVEDLIYPTQDQLTEAFKRKLEAGKE
jgi:hypothetical protein